MASWRGESGERYAYSEVKLPHDPPDRTGNYIFAKRKLDDKGEFQYWLAVYVGEGNLRDRYNAAIREGCVTDKSATHYHYHTKNENLPYSRKKEESDIIEGNPECKHPRGCNGVDP